MIMNNRRKLLAGAIFLILIFCVNFQLQRYLIQNEVVATVNGQEILYKDVQKIYLQLDSEDNPQIVLESLINEMVVVSNADDIGIEITDRDIYSVVNEYKTTLPDVYKEGIRIYGKKDFYEGIKLQIIYDNVYDIVVEEMLQNNEEQLKEDYYNQKKKEKDFPTGMSKEEFLEKYYIDFEEYVFDNWLEAKRKSADIKIYKNMEDIR